MGRRRFLVPQVTTEYRKPSEVPPNHPFAEVEEVELSPMNLEDRRFDSDVCTHFLQGGDYMVA